MQTFLTPRSTVENGEGHEKRVEKDDEEMDVDEHPGPEEDTPLIVKDTTRVVDEREMHEFVEIFKQYGFKGSCERRLSDLSTVDKVFLQLRVLARGLPEYARTG